MNLFNTVERSSGENLSSAVLRYLLLRSMPARAALLNFLSDQSPCGPVYAEEQFGVFLEVATATPNSKSEEEIKGRVDLLLECDGAVIGIENKFDAEFQEGQPGKYLHTVKERAQQLSKSRNLPPDAMRSLLFVLAPEQRQAYVKEQIGQQNLQGCCAFISWQSVLAKLSTVDDADPVNRFLMSELQDYVNERIDFPPNIGRLLPHVAKTVPSRGSDLHAHMNDLLWPVFTAQLRQTYRRATANYYNGYYFGPSRHPKRCWYGFIDRGSVNSDGPGCAFIVSTNLPITTVEDLQAVTVEGWTEHGWHCWEIPYELSWTLRSTWEEAVKPFNRAVAVFCEGDDP